jgi:hypothetical protein
MPSKLIRSPELVLREEEEKRNSKERFTNFRLRYTSEAGEVILATGDIWDNTKSCVHDEPHNKAYVVKLKDSQLEYFRWFAQWLEAFKTGAPRDTRFVLTAGKRRGGKTTAGVLSMIALAVSQPNMTIWAVSPSYEKRDEIDNEIAALFSWGRKKWFVYKGQPRYRYIFNNGSQIRHISADDPELLKQGKVELVFLNEAQLQQSRAFTNALPGNIDRGGLTLLAANPAVRVIGQWVNEVHEAIQTGKITRAKYFFFDPAQNSAIDQEARNDIGDILRVVDPKVAAADDEGLWLPVGEVAYQNFRTIDHVKAIPREYRDITRDVTRRIFGREYDYVNGADFQTWPYHATVSLKIYQGPDCATKARKTSSLTQSTTRVSGRQRTRSGRLTAQERGKTARTQRTADVTLSITSRPDAGIYTRRGCPRTRSESPAIRRLRIV